MTIKAAIILQISKITFPSPPILPKEIPPGPSPPSRTSVPNTQGINQPTTNPLYIHTHPSTSTSLRNERLQRRRILAIRIRKSHLETASAFRPPHPRLHHRLRPPILASQVHGIAYRIPPTHVPSVKTYLDMREINGYSIQHTTFYPSPSPQSSSFPSPPVSPQQPQPPHPKPIPHCTIYIGLPNNPQFHPQPPQEIAKVIARSQGPSGANAEYLFMLEAGLRELRGEEGEEEEGGAGCVDEHVRDLAARVRVLMGRDGDGDGEGKDNDGKVEVRAVEKEVQRVRRGDGGQASEETEKGITGLEID